jgi:hypothetical protein
MASQTLKTLRINRAPVLTLWAAIVAERMGHSSETALTLGKAVAGLNAQSKARRLGLVEAKPEGAEGKKSAAKAARGPKTVEVLGRAVPVKSTRAGLRALAKGEAIKPATVQRYLEEKFGDNLPAVRAALEALAQAYTPTELEAKAYELYEAFRPAVPEGQKGWGAMGELDLVRIRRRARR